MEQISKILILIGILFVFAGILWQLGFPLGRLPGDIYIKRENFTFYFPVTTMILISIVISVVANLFLKK